MLRFSLLFLLWIQFHYPPKVGMKSHMMYTFDTVNHNTIFNKSVGHYETSIDTSKRKYMLKIEILAQLGKKLK